MLFEKSFQAQVLIPMATSLAFGLLGSTALVLLMVPFLYQFYAKIALTAEQMQGIWEKESEPSGPEPGTGPLPTGPSSVQPTIPSPV